LEHPFWFDQADGLRLNRSLGSNEFDAFCIRKLRKIGVSDFAPTFSTSHVYEESFQPLEECGCSYFGALYSLTWSPVELTTRNSKIENLPAARRALHHILQDRRIHNGAVRRKRGTTPFVVHEYRSRPIAATLTSGMTSAFRHNDGCALRIGGRDCWFVPPDNSACTALNGLSIRPDSASQLRPANR
jgi:hypothetical protein